MNCFMLKMLDYVLNGQSHMVSGLYVPRTYLTSHTRPKGRHNKLVGVQCTFTERNCMLKWPLLIGKLNQNCSIVDLGFTDGDEKS